MEDERLRADLITVSGQLAEEETVTYVSLIQQAFLLTAVALSSLIYGSKVAPSDFSRCVKKAKGLWLSLLISVLLSPLLAYILTLIMPLDSHDRITLLVVSYCPAGTLSPIFAYYTQSEIALCLSVIVLSTLMSVGMIPLGVYICSSTYKELDLTVIPNGLIVANLCISMGGIALGMWLRLYKEKWADRLVKILSSTPILIIVIMIILVSVKLPIALHVLGIFTVLLYLIIVLVVAYLLGYLVDQDPDICRAMAFSSANKNVVLAISMIHSSFSGEVLVDTLPLPALFLAEYILIGLLLSLLYRLHKNWSISTIGDALVNINSTKL